MYRTRTALALTLNAALVLTGATIAQAGQVAKYKNNGAYAEAAGSDTGCRDFYVVVSRGGTTASPQTYLFYDVYDRCTGTWSWGSGTIPNASFNTGPKAMTLNFTGSTSGGFTAEGESLAITLTFTKDSVFTYTWSGHSRLEYYGHIVQHHGSGDAKYSCRVRHDRRISRAGVVGKHRHRTRPLDRVRP